MSEVRIQVVRLYRIKKVLLVLLGLTNAILVVYHQVTWHYRKASGWR